MNWGQFNLLIIFLMSITITHMSLKAKKNIAIEDIFILEY
jgi:hypothetical protein